MSPLLEKVYAAVFIDTDPWSKVCDGLVRHQPCYAVIGVDLDGRKDMLGIWPGNGDGGASEVLVRLPDRVEEPWRHGCVLRRL